MNAKIYADGKTQEELLGELIVYQKREMRHTRFATFANILLIVALIVALVVLIPRAVRLIDHMESELVKLDARMQEMDELFLEADELIDNMNEMVVSNTGAVTETVQKLNQVDFEGLNQAIQDLGSVVKPLGEFSRRFLGG